MQVGLLGANVMRFATAAGAAELAGAAEAAGFDSLWTAEHVLWPDGYESEYPYAEGGRMPGDVEHTDPRPADLADVGRSATRARSSWPPAS